MMLRAHDIRYAGMLALSLPTSRAPCQTSNAWHLASANIRSASSIARASSGASISISLGR